MSKTFAEHKRDLENELEVAEIDFKSETLVHYATGRISGFDKCDELWRAEVKVLVEALEHYEVSHYDLNDNPCVHDDTANKALQAFKERVKE